MRVITNADELAAHRGSPHGGEPVVIPDGGALGPAVADVPPGSVVFAGTAAPEMIAAVVRSGSLALDLSNDVYRPARTALYTPDELFSDFDCIDPCTYCATLDARIFRHWCDTGRAHPEPIEALSRRIHDHRITELLHSFLGPRRVVGVMGGHDIARGAAEYVETVALGRALTRRGYVVVTGGGPGAMEAANLGAALANADDATVAEAIEMLAIAPDFRHRLWLATAITLRRQLVASIPDLGESVGIPTWLYGHEPPNVFATRIAKYFENSVREDGLVSVATHGIVFTPGSAGTVQELFQDAAQNHYATVRGMSSPMVLIGRRYWADTMPVMAVLDAIGGDRPWVDLVTAVDTAAEAVDWIDTHPPASTTTGGWSYCDAFCAEADTTA